MNILTRILSILNGQRETPAYACCQCGKQAGVTEDNRLYCGRCYLRKIGKL